MFKLTDQEVVKVATALSHPTRLAIVRGLRSETDSPSSWADENGESVGNSAYHFRQLQRLGVASLAGTRKRRGALEHIYALEGPLAKPVLTALDLLDGRVNATST